ncbi:MAG: tRNA (adenosine(37)-N6)-threonylcarbamoyltransferase complex ATPase subunit type 1 TsaE [Cytophagales bacterium]
MLVYSKDFVQESDLNEVVVEIYSLSKDFNIWCLEGEMGVGKTTFVKSLAQYLDMKNVSSPTFSIVNQYHSSKIGDVYHFDFYRLKSINEALDVGVEDYFYSGQLCLIEWGRKINMLIPEKFAKIEINLCNLNQRTFNLYLYGGQNEIRN